jgi:hypothetical protein
MAEHSTFGNTPKEASIYIYIYIYIYMRRTVPGPHILFTAPQSWRQPKCPSAGELMNKGSYTSGIQ